MLNFLRRLLKVEQEITETPEDLAIGILERQLALVNAEKKQLLDLIIELQRPSREPEIVRPPSADIKPIMPNFTPWKVRQQMLEREDASKARLMKRQSEEQAEIDKLEKELSLNASEHSTEQNGTDK